MSARVTAVDDAAWAGPWRSVAVGDKVALSLALVLTALLTPAWPGSVLVAVVAVALMLGPARIRPGLLAAVALPPLAFLVAGAAPLAVEVQLGEWPRVTPDGVARAAGVVAHGVAGSLSVLLLATTTPMVDMVGWLRRLRVPGPLLEIAELMYRLLFVLADTAVALHAAQAGRLGGQAPLRRRFRHAASAVGTVALHSWHRATRLQAGLALRGFEEDLPTLSPAGRRTPRLLIAGLVVVAGVVAACWAVA